jgi:hypothetical protein
MAAVWVFLMKPCGVPSVDVDGLGIVALIVDLEGPGGEDHTVALVGVPVDDVELAGCTGRDTRDLLHQAGAEAFGEAPGLDREVYVLRILHLPGVPDVMRLPGDAVKELGDLPLDQLAHYLPLSGLLRPVTSRM